jgi:hypothetical protein
LIPHSTAVSSVVSEKFQYDENQPLFFHSSDKKDAIINNEACKINHREIGDVLVVEKEVNALYLEPKTCVKLSKLGC